MLLLTLYLFLQIIPLALSGSCGCGCCDSDSSARTVIAFMPSAPAVYAAPPIAYAPPPVAYAPPPISYAAPPPIAYYSPSAYSTCNLGCLSRKRRVAENGDLDELERDATMKSVQVPELAKSRPPISGLNKVSPGISIGNGTYYFDKLRNGTDLNSQITAQVFDNTLGVQTTVKPSLTDLGYINVTLKGHIVPKRQADETLAAANNNSSTTIQDNCANCAICKSGVGCAANEGAHSCCLCPDCLKAATNASLTEPSATAMDRDLPTNIPTKTLQNQ
uniref:Uncharacterized protein n=1 Tax=Ditylenchus dipsaci TaxID=166011 RepID=A0A915D6L5_9BILA